MRPGTLTSALVVAATLALPAPAPAYVVAGERWPSSTVRIRVDDPRLRVPARAAIAAWDGARTGFHLILAGPGRRADVRAVAQGRGCSGLSTVGFQPSGRPDVMRLTAGCPAVLMRTVFAHELGHVLGLGHETRRCALMNPTSADGRPELCTTAGPVVRADDIAGVRRLARQAPVDPFAPGLGAEPFPARASP